jgi:hypothetical protein
MKTYRLRCKNPYFDEVKDCKNLEEAKEWKESCIQLFGLTSAILELVEIESIYPTISLDKDYGVDFTPLFSPNILGRGKVWKCYNHSNQRFIGMFEGTKQEVARQLRNLGYFKARIRRVRSVKQLLNYPPNK